jgi:copper homeostasis protein
VAWRTSELGLVRDSEPGWHEAIQKIDGVCPRHSMKNFLFELCAESVEAARAGEFGGADRIELCSQLSMGGVTPPLSLINSATRTLSIPVHILIRPRPGDFVFSSEEFELMKDQIEQARQAGAGGVAVGVLLPDGSVDVERSRELVHLSRPLSVTFHRAFDETVDLNEALEAVIDTGADCLLTSGGAEDVLAGADSIARLRTQAGTRVDIMAAGGLHLANLLEVVRRTGVTHVHGSLTRRHLNGANIDSQSLRNGHSAVNGSSGIEADVRESVRLLTGELKLRESGVRTAR